MYSMLWASLLALAPQADSLEVRFIGNAGVRLSAGGTTLLVDLPYRSGAFGYMAYDPASIEPEGMTVSVITHAHADHFDADLLQAQVWPVIGGAGVGASLPMDRVLSGDSITVGDFSVVAVATPHTAGHRSYRIRWRNRTLYFTGDTEDMTALTSQPPLDVLFITPWLSCTLERAGGSVSSARVVAYHQDPAGSDEFCASAVPMRQGDSLVLRPR